jgi:FkbM family methyltransferase
LKRYVQDLLAGDGKIRWIGAGAGDKSGILPLTISYRDDASSLTPTSDVAMAAGMRQIEVPMITLSEIVAKGDAPFPDMVKIDAEGFDLKVLAGAHELIGKTDIFLLEATVCAMATISRQEFENTLANVIQAMVHAGYRVLDITHLNRSPKYGVLWLCEVAFLRNGSHLLSGVDSYE